MFTFQYNTMSEAAVEKLVKDSGCFIISMTSTKNVTVSGSEAEMKKLKETLEKTKL